MSDLPLMDFIGVLLVAWALVSAALLYNFHDRLTEVERRVDDLDGKEWRND